MQYPTIDEIKLLLRHVKVPRHRLMILMTFHHGLRASETVGKKGLRGRHIQGGIVSVKRLKGSERTNQAFVKHPDPELDEYTALTALAATVKPNELLFPLSRQRFWSIMKQAGERAGISPGARYNNKLHPHALKHSIAMHTIHEAGIENVRVWLGHKTIASTGEYLKVNDETAAVAIGAALMAKTAAAGA